MDSPFTHAIITAWTAWLEVKSSQFKTSNYKTLPPAEKGFITFYSTTVFILEPGLSELAVTSSEGHRPGWPGPQARAGPALQRHLTRKNDSGKTSRGGVR